MIREPSIVAVGLAVVLSTIAVGAPMAVTDSGATTSEQPATTSSMVASLSELENDGGGDWEHTLWFPASTKPDNRSIFTIEIDGTDWTLQDMEGNVKAEGSNETFWSAVQSDGDDIRVHDPYSGVENGFWLKNWDAESQTAVIWVRVRPDTSGIAVSFGNDAAGASPREGKENAYGTGYSFGNNSAGTIATSSDWLGRPVLAKDDGTWVMVYRKAPQHGSDSSSQLNIRFSDDEGETWTNANTNLDGTDVGGFPIQGWTSDPLLIEAPNGDLLLHIGLNDDGSDGSNFDGSEQWRSTNGGQSWTLEGKMGETDVERNEMCACNDYEVVDGTIYEVRHYGAPSNVGLYKSDDSGGTWTHVSNVTAPTDPETGEVGLVHPGNSSLLTVMRDTSDTSTTTYQRRSDDMGETWGTLETKDSLNVLQRPRLRTMGAEGGRILAWGRDDGSGKTGVYWTDNNGRTWTGPFYPDGTSYTDTGYSDIRQRTDGTFYMASYGGSKTDADLTDASFDSFTPALVNDFEDGSLDGWGSNNAGTFDLVQSGAIDGSYSARLNESGTNGAHAVVNGVNYVDMVVEADVKINAAHDYSAWGVSARAVTATRHYGVDLADPTDNRMFLRWWDSGSGNNIDQMSKSWSEGETRQFTLTVQGSSVEGELDDGTTMSGTDSSLTGPGDAGFVADDAEVFADNFSVRPLNSPGSYGNLTAIDISFIDGSTGSSSNDTSENVVSIDDAAVSDEDIHRSGVFSVPLLGEMSIGDPQTSVEWTSTEAVAEDDQTLTFSIGNESAGDAFDQATRTRATGDWLPSVQVLVDGTPTVVFANGPGDHDWISGADAYGVYHESNRTLALHFDEGYLDNSREVDVELVVNQRMGFFAAYSMFGDYGVDRTDRISLAGDASGLLPFVQGSVLSTAPMSPPPRAGVMESPP